jgi:O-acetyl-ADP-ribose deacetylase (regulator of RNase III)
MLRVVTGDLFESNVDALVNPVNTVGVMGKGLALEFKKRYPANFRAYAKACKRGELELGRVFAFETGTSPRYIVNFPTKRHWRESSQLADIEAGLTDLVRFMKEREVSSIAVPALGAGLGGLEWPSVRELIQAKLGALSNVEVIVFAPEAPET